MKKLLLTLFLIVGFSPMVLAQVGTSEATVKVYQGYLSTNGNCSSPVLFLDAESDSTNFPDGYAQVDMAASPTIGTGTIAEGTYKCAIFKMSDQITFKPDADSGASCQEGVQVSMDVCQDHGTGAPTVTDKDGNQTSCAAAEGTEDTIWIYISTFSATDGGSEDHDAFSPPATDGASEGFKLNNEITISADVTGTFVFGTAGKVESSAFEDACDMQPPDFGFSVAE